MFDQFIYGAGEVAVSVGLMFAFSYVAFKVCEWWHYR